MSFWSKHDKLEDRLRAEKPRPSDDLVSSIKGDLKAAGRVSRRGLRPQLRLAGITAALFAGLLVIGGAGYAMTSISSVIDSVSTHIGIRTTVRTVVLNAANDQYGTTTTQTTTQTTTSATTTTSSGAKSTNVQTSTPGSLTVAPSGDPAQQTKVTWSATTFATPVIIAVNPTPPAGVLTFHGPATQSVVNIVVTDPKTGLAVHELSAPLEIGFPNAPAGYVPAFSEDGLPPFQSLPELTSPSLPVGQKWGFYRDGTTVRVFTRHLTAFAVLYKANLGTSESGRKTATAGSGKFGDPTRIHIGAPVVTVPASATASGSDVGVSFFVDEQVALYAHVVSGSSELVLGGSSTLRGHTVGGKSRKTLHLVILRPGTMNLNLHVPGLKPGAQVQLIMVDFDGHKVVKTITIK